MLQIKVNPRNLVILWLYLGYWCSLSVNNYCGVNANPSGRNKRPANYKPHNWDKTPEGENRKPVDIQNRLVQLGLNHGSNPANLQNKYAPYEAQVQEPQLVKENYPPQVHQLVEPQPELNNNNYNNFLEQPQPQQFQPPPKNSIYQQAQPIPFAPNSRQVQRPPHSEAEPGDKQLPYLYQSEDERKCFEDTCICPMIYNPVCGLDINPRGHQYPDKGFRTFGNACAFRCSQKCNKYLQFTYCGECSPNHYFPNPGDPAPSIECITNVPLQPQPLVEPQILRRGPREGSRILVHDEE